MELLSEHQITEADAAQLRVLYATSFGGMNFSQGPEATVRAILRRQGNIIAHAASSVRAINLHPCNIELAVLGLVCVHPHHRGQSLGHQVIRALHDAVLLPFMLNCGRSLVPYYAQINYTVIASAASYLRNGALVVDDDPVMLFPNGHPVSTAMRRAPIHFGEDF